MLNQLTNNYTGMLFLSCPHLPGGWGNPWIFILKEALWVVQLLRETSRYQLPNNNYGGTLTVQCKIDRWQSFTSYNKYCMTHMPELFVKVMLVPLCSVICPKDDKCRAPEKPSGS